MVLGGCDDCAKSVSGGVGEFGPNRPDLYNLVTHGSRLREDVFVWWRAHRVEMYSLDSTVKILYSSVPTPLDYFFVTQVTSGVGFLRSYGARLDHDGHSEPPSNFILSPNIKNKKPPGAYHRRLFVEIICYLIRLVKELFFAGADRSTAIGDLEVFAQM